MTRDEVVAALVERPQGFDIDGRRLYLYPLTLGRLELIAGLGLEVGEGLPSLEVLRVVRLRREVSIHALAIFTLKRKRDVMGEALAKRRAYLDEVLSDEQLATLLITAFSMDKTAALLRHYGIDKEGERRAQVMKSKEHSNVWTFGGRSIYGNLIDAACERYGWSYDYVLWGVSFTSLTLMLRDQVTQVYLTDKEAKRCKVSKGVVADGNDIEQVRAFMRTMR